MRDRDLGVDAGGVESGVAGELLDNANVCPVFVQVENYAGAKLCRA